MSAHDEAGPVDADENEASKETAQGSASSKQKYYRQSRPTGMATGPAVKNLIAKQDQRPAYQVPEINSELPSCTVRSYAGYNAEQIADNCKEHRQ